MSNSIGKIRGLKIYSENIKGSQNLCVYTLTDLFGGKLKMSISKDFLRPYLYLLNKAYGINCLRGTWVPRQNTVQQFTQVLKLERAISCSMQLYDQLCKKEAHPQLTSEICPVPS